MADSFIHIDINEPNKALLDAFAAFEGGAALYPHETHAALQHQFAGEVPSTQTPQQLRVSAAITELLNETNNGFYIDYDKPLLSDILKDSTYKELKTQLRLTEGEDRARHIRQMALRGLTIYVEQRLAQTSEAS